MKRATLIVIYSILTVFSQADVVFNDGGTHNINYAIADNVTVDFETPNMETTVNILDGGTISYGTYGYQDSSINVDGGTLVDLFGLSDNSQANIISGSILKLRAWDNSHVTIFGGMISQYLYAHHNSQLIVSGGSSGYLGAFQDSYVNFSGGTVEGRLTADDNAIVEITGGTIGDIFYAYMNGNIYLGGSDFEVNGTPLTNGDKVSSFGTFIENGDEDYYTGLITGILDDGSILNNEFRIYNTGTYLGNADIVIIPEPATLCLLAIGGLLLRRRKA